MIFGKTSRRKMPTRAAVPAVSGSRSVDAVNNPQAVPVTVGPKNAAIRSIKAGQIDRLTASWTPIYVSTNGQIRISLRALRGRSREQFFNNDYAKNFYRKLKVNVVGDTGFRLKSKPLDPSGKLDTGAKAEVEGAFLLWGKKGTCDVTGRLSWADCCSLFLETTGRDGEVLVRKWPGFDNGFGYAIQFLEPDLLDIDYNELLPNGNVVRMGVEYDRWDRAVAYHLLTYNPNDYGPRVVNAPQIRERVPAEFIKHGFITEFIRQGRGIPWGHAAMRRLNRLEAYEEAELEAARTAAAKMGFFTENADGEETYEGSEETADGELLTSAEAGTFEVLPPGVDFKPWDPQHPSGNFQPFRVGLLKAISAGFGISYPALGGDAADLSFSALRHVTIEDRDLYKMLQRWLIEDFCDWVFADFLPCAMLAGKIRLPFAKLEKFRGHEFEGRAWAWVDPLKDGKAKSQELDDGVTTRTAILREKGVEYEDHLREKKRERELETTILGAPLAPEEEGKPAAPAA